MEHAPSVATLVDGPEEGGSMFRRNLTWRYVAEYCNFPTASSIYYTWSDVGAVGVSLERYLAGNMFSWGDGLVLRIYTYLLTYSMEQSPS